MGCLPLHTRSGFFAQFLRIADTSSWAHGSCVVGRVCLVFDLDVGVIPWDDHGLGTFSPTVRWADRYVGTVGGGG